MFKACSSVQVLSTYTSEEQKFAISFDLILDKEIIVILN